MTTNLEENQQKSYFPKAIIHEYHHLENTQLIIIPNAHKFHEKKGWINHIIGQERLSEGILTSSKNLQLFGEIKTNY